MNHETRHPVVAHIPKGLCPTDRGEMMFLDGFVALLLATIALGLVVFGTCAMIVGERKIVMLAGLACLLAACAVGTWSMMYFVEFFQTALGT